MPLPVSLVTTVVPAVVTVRPDTVRSLTQLPAATQLNTAVLPAGRVTPTAVAMLSTVSVLAP